MRVVCNTSPLILLAKIKRLALLPQLYAEVIIPASVLEEISVKPDRATEQIQEMIQRQTLQHLTVTEEVLEGFPADLGGGEREAIALAHEKGADLVVLDDQQGRHVARARGLGVTGTIGVLVEAWERKMIPSVRHELDHLIEAGMWMNEALYHRMFMEFGE